MVPKADFKCVNLNSGSITCPCVWLSYIWSGTLYGEEPFNSLSWCPLTDTRSTRESLCQWQYLGKKQDSKINDGVGVGEHISIQTCWIAACLGFRRHYSTKDMDCLSHVFDIGKISVRHEECWPFKPFAEGFAQVYRRLQDNSPPQHDPQPHLQVQLHICARSFVDLFASAV